MSLGNYKKNNNDMSLHTYQMAKFKILRTPDISEDVKLLVILIPWWWE